MAPPTPRVTRPPASLVQEIVETIVAINRGGTTILLVEQTVFMAA